MSWMIMCSAGKPMHEFTRGIKRGLPIAFGYLPVSFTFGLMAVGGGIPVWIAVFISMTNLTSAGQFAGMGLMLTGAPLVEIALTTWVVNLRYLLMSLSLSQKIVSGMSAAKRCLLAFGITDEIFTLAAMEEEEVGFSFMLGLIVGPYCGWALGTLLGGVSAFLLPEILQNAMGITLYAMFIALLVPAAKKSAAALGVIAIAVTISTLFTWVPYLNRISGGWSIILATILASAAGALFFPREEGKV